MEAGGLLTRMRSREDERNLVITITEAGEALKERAVDIPQKVMACTKLDREDAETLYRILYKILGQKNKVQA